ncbi:gephyrin-like molybdotransferase Glp [Chloroflexota bacterium]
MISVEEAKEKILGNANVLEPQTVPVLEALGQVLAEDVISGINIPPLDNSAMDGYAVIATDTTGTGERSPKVLKVIETVMAGSVGTKELTPGHATRIMTGAPIPTGANSIVRFEDTDEESRKNSGASPSEIGIHMAVKPGKDIRRAGEDITAASLVLTRGTVVKPSVAGVLASLGLSRVNVVRRPVVGILATGDELVPLGEKLAPGKIYNSNTYSLAAQCRSFGAVPKILGIALDNEESLKRGIRDALKTDMLVTSGGVSMGDYDKVKNILAAEGDIAFWTVRMKPGKPLAFGTLRSPDGRRIPHLGLPGNPVSSMITFELFGRLAVAKMMGKPLTERPMIRVILEDMVKNTDSRRIYARAVVSQKDGRYYAKLTGAQGSGILTSMSAANGLVIVPEDVPQLAVGAEASALMIDWNTEITELTGGAAL